MTGISLVPVLLWGLALICTSIAVWREGPAVERGFVIDRLLRYLFLFPIGILGVWAFVGHVFFPARSAAAIGWSTSPFQYEVGVADLGFGLAAIYAAFKGFEARVAVGIAAACFSIGAGIGHIRDIVATGNLAPGNAGPIMITDFLTPVAVIVLLIMASGKLRPKSSATLALEAELENARKAMREYRDALSQLGK